MFSEVDKESSRWAESPKTLKSLGSEVHSKTQQMENHPCIE